MLSTRTDKDVQRGTKTNQDTQTELQLKHIITTKYTQGPRKKITECTKVKALGVNLSFSYGSFCRAFHRFGPAKFAYGGPVLGSSRFLLLSQLPQKWGSLQKWSKVFQKKSSLVINLNPWHTLYLCNNFCSDFFTKR